MKRLLHICLPLFCLLSTTFALAGGPEVLPSPAPESGFYFGAGIALEDAITERHDDNIITTVPPISARLTQTRYGFGPTGFIGYTFNPHWAVELGFTWLRDTVYTLTTPNLLPLIGVARISQKYFAYLVGIRRFPVRDHFAFFIKAGAGWYHKLYTLAFTAIPLATSISSINSFVFVYGAGIEFPIQDTFGIRFQYTGLAFADHLDPFHFVPNYLSADIYFKFSA